MQIMKKIVVFTGAGVSADSGVATFRDANGLWANYRVEDVGPPEAVRTNRAQGVEFYNMRRRESLSKEPNAGHYAIARMEEWAEVIVITQNVDNVHERAGSKNVLHLHGELMKRRSERIPNLIYDIDGWEQPLDEKAEDGALLRPHIVFFGEDVPMFNSACRIVEDADILVVVGTSLQVYPAAYLVDYAKAGTPIYVVDPGTPDISRIRNEVIHIQERGAVGMPQLEQQLKEQLLKG